MTDEQIIIDGVDVSGCENLMQGIVPFGCMEDRKTCSCMNNPNCLYKQLKRKEQLLKSAENHIKDLDLMVHNGEERENELEQKFKAKEQECEELKNQVNSSADTITRLVKKMEEYEKEYKRLEDENKILHKLKESI